MKDRFLVAFTDLVILSMVAIALGLLVSVFGG